MSREFEISIEPIQPVDRATPGSTAYHEAVHTVAAILTGSHVMEASKVPGSGYWGSTELDGFNPIAFVAAHAMGCSGTGHDVSVLVSQGHDPNLLAGEARSLLAYHKDEINAVASLIESRGTISGHEAVLAMNRAINPEAKVRIIDPLGNERHFVTKIRKNWVGGQTQFVPK
ncbi:MAG: hypothetical protein G01um10147_1163 [Microgenomates group bacterium Gr01-1014_7]|nr:MAG: hypothetical protein G01um10147_1163 [Microgenomates group bacterium Gr01-1014_7]